MKSRQKAFTSLCVSLFSRRAFTGWKRYLKKCQQRGQFTRHNFLDVFHLIASTTSSPASSLPHAFSVSKKGNLSTIMMKKKSLINEIDIDLESIGLGEGKRREKLFFHLWICRALHPAGHFRRNNGHEIDISRLMKLDLRAFANLWTENLKIFLEATMANENVLSNIHSFNVTRSSERNAEEKLSQWRKCDADLKLVISRKLQTYQQPRYAWQGEKYA